MIGIRLTRRGQSDDSPAGLISYTDWARKDVRTFVGSTQVLGHTLKTTEVAHSATSATPR